MSNKFDVVVIGSGIGGLTCGAFLARSGKKVLVLEKHFQIGGYTHSFKRRGFTFESAVHSVPLGSNGLVMHLLKQLGKAQEITAIPHDSMYTSSWPDFSYTVAPYAEQIIESLNSQFPYEKQNIRDLFQSMTGFYDSFVTPIKEGSLEESDHYKHFISTHQNRSYKDYLDEFISDEKLRRILYSQWPFGGTPPSSAPVAYYVLMFIVHAIEGSHYMEGGFSKLADVLASVITEAGGAVLTKKEVVALKVHNKSVKSVVTSKGEEYFADLVISNISPQILHGDLLEPHARNKLWLRRLKNLAPSVSSVIVYLGLTENIDDLLKDNITFWYAHDNDRKIFDNCTSKGCKEPDHLIFLKPGQHSGGPTLTIMNFVRSDCSENWKTDKKLFAQKILEKAEEIYPGLNSRISMQEIGSPDTFQRYTSNTDGSLYGFENTNSLYGEAKLPAKTHISNLYQAGHWGKPGGGIWNSMYNGYNAFLMINRDDPGVG